MALKDYPYMFIFFCKKRQNSWLSSFEKNVRFYGNLITKLKFSCVEQFSLFKDIKKYFNDKVQYHIIMIGIMITGTVEIIRCVFFFFFKIIVSNGIPYIWGNCWYGTVKVLTLSETLSATRKGLVH